MAVGDIGFGGSFGLDSAHLQPTQGKNLYQGNYLDFTNGTIDQWTQQFLPDVYDKEIEIYGNRTISGFLKMVSAEMPSSSDQIIWLEQGRLHTRYTGLSASSDTATAAGGTETFTLPASQRGPEGTTAQNANRRIVPSGTTEGSDQINFRIGQTVMLQQENAVGRAASTITTDSSRGIGEVFKGIISDVGTTTFDVLLYTAKPTPESGTETPDDPATPPTAANATYTALAYGSEFAKGTGNFVDKLDPSYTTYQNSPIIMKEHYSINGSDTGQIGWVEVTSENGASGYLWYVKAEHENRLRWEDYQEMAMLEAVPYGGAAAQLPVDGASDFGGTLNTVNDGQQFVRGTQGFFHALQHRGNVYSGLAEELGYTAGGSTGLTRLNSTFDNILRQMDKQGAIEENMLYANRDLMLAFDDFLATQNNYGGTDGVSWGVFNNKMDNAIDFGFTGFRRGSYDFYKTDWKYLNDYSTRGGFGDIEGVMIPAGTSTVYDSNLGKNIKRPFLHIRYRASETDNRKMKSWITGSVGGAYTTDVDELRMHYLTEKCLITQGANNFFLLEN